MDIDPDHDMDERAESVLIPGLPTELAVQCIARIPRGLLGICVGVSKAWRELIQSRELVDMRRSLGIFEDWPFVLLQGRESGRIWRALDPVVLNWMTLPSYPAAECFHMGDKECFVAGRKLLVSGLHSQVLPPDYILETGQVIWCYDVDENLWRLAPAMTVMRCLFASASTGIYAYVAGGTIFGTGQVSNTVERFNSVTNAWEVLPSMTHERRECSGFIMDSRFYVIGGVNTRGEQHSHGEYYDPETNTWTTVRNFWAPRDRQQNPGRGAPPLVAVLKDELYALDAASNELKHYDKASGAWTSLTAVPGRAHHANGWGLAFKALDGELWVIGGRSPTGQQVGDIQAFRPDPVRGRHTPWRRVTGTFRGDGFCLNCAVMKM